MTAISNLAPLPGNTVSISYILIFFLFIYLFYFIYLFIYFYFTHRRLIEFVFFVVFSFPFFNISSKILFLF